MAEVRRLEEQIRFQCDCGKRLRAPVSAAGRKATCRYCGKRVIIPAPLSSCDDDTIVYATVVVEDRSDTENLRGNASRVESLTQAVQPRRVEDTGKKIDRPARQSRREQDKSVASAQLCSICQTPIQATESKTQCSECSLPFHQECWEENLGCSAYGCPNVSALQPDTNTQSDSTPPLQPVTQVVASNSPTQQSEIPWDYALLASSALAALLGSFCFGVFSLFVGAIALIFVAASKKDKSYPVLAACLAMSFIGFILGFVLSVYYWS